MSVNHGRAHVTVTEELLDGPDVVAVLQQMGGKTVAIMPGPALSALCRVPDYAGWDRGMAKSGRVSGCAARHNQRLFRKAKRRSPGR